MTSIAGARTLGYLSLILSLVSAARLGRAAVGEDLLVQPPALAVPGKASLAGSLSGVAFGPADMVRGSFTLPLAVSAPTERGPLQVNVWPTYSADGGLSEWGQGWSQAIAIRRFRPVGEVAFDDGDQLAGPWGTLARGDDGAYYPTGASKSVRLVIEGGGGLRAITADGASFRFEVGDALDTPRGIYAWYLSEVRAPSGEVTRLSYQRNASGRPFLASARYGGRGDDAEQVEISVVYEPLVAPLSRDYRSGVLQELDRRVAEAVVQVRTRTGLETRMTHRFAYTSSPLGSAFYLAQVDTVMRSGQALPPIRYRYDLEQPWPSAGSLTPVPGLGALFASWGSSALLPSRATVTDVDDDGLADVETANGHVLARQKANGQFVLEPLPSPDQVPAFDARCRPTNQPRVLARSSPGELAPSIFVVSPGSQNDTEVRRCSRAGQLLELHTFPSQWRLDAMTRLSDLDRDGRPDLVRLGHGSVQVVANRATGWVVQPSRALSEQTVDAMWTHDLNGDGVADLVGKRATGVVVWMGRGGLTYEHQHIPTSFRTLGGSTFSDFSGTLSFVDANSDGAADVVVTNASTGRLFISRGFSTTSPTVMIYQQVAIPQLPGGALYPLAAELSASGENELTIAAAGQGYALRLTRPSSGLLVAVDDGKGTEVGFGYDRAAASAGLRMRPVVVARVTVRTAGRGEVAHTYDYRQPVVHPLGRFLIGFAEIEKLGVEGSETMTFHHDQDFAGLPLTSVRREAQDPVERFATTIYETTTYHGLRLMRPVLQNAGISGPAGVNASSSMTHLLGYERGICPVLTRQMTRHGMLEARTSLAAPAQLPTELHCLPQVQQATGRHADATLDFDYVFELARNPLGQLTRATARAGEEAVVLQDVAYDAYFRVASIGAPGHGTTTIGYDGATSLVERIISPEGVLSEATDRDPITDLLRSQRTGRGGGVTYSDYFRYDGLERLSKRWNQLAGSEEAPVVSHGYTYAQSNGTLATLSTQTRVNPTSVRREFDVLAGSGEAAALLRQMPEGWKVSRLTSVDPAALAVRSLRRATLPPKFVNHAFRIGDLLDGAVELTLATSATDGTGTVARTKLGSDVVFERTTEKLADGSGLVVISHNGHDTAGTFRVEKQDEQGRVMWRDDEAGQTMSLAYDALGRLVTVTLPDGTTQRRRFDGFGRPSAIERAGKVTTVWRYDALGRVHRIERFGTAGTAVRSVDIVRDGIGRPTREIHTELATGQTQVFHFERDGVIAGEPVIAGQLGRLTRVRGDGFDKRSVYGADGRLATVTISFPGWRSLEQRFTYHHDGAVESETWTVRDGGGSQLLRMQKEDRYDGFGRLQTVLLDDQDLARFSYDAHGDLETIGLAGDAELTYRYDGETRGLSGYDLSAGTHSDKISWTWNARGLLASETMRFDGAPRSRVYDYDARGYLTGAGGDEGATYRYDDASLPSFTRDLAGARDFVRNGAELSAGGVTYHLDELGRVTRKGDLVLSYGPDGQLARAQRGAAEWQLIRDQEGHRLAKARDGAIVEAYVGGGLLTSTSFIVPYKVNGKVVGILENGRFRPLLADARGTVVRAPESAPGVATPFGVRDARPQTSAALDYVEKGYDSDLEVVRMGIRDYDPYLGRFWQPDPLILTSIDACAASAADCNLYSYARNNPLVFADRDGRMPTAAELAAAAANGFTGAADRVIQKVGELASLPAAVRDGRASLSDLGASYARGVALSTPVGFTMKSAYEIGVLAGDLAGTLIYGDAKEIATKAGEVGFYAAAAVGLKVGLKAGAAMIAEGEVAAATAREGAAALGSAVAESEAPMASAGSRTVGSGGLQIGDGEFVREIAHGEKVSDLISEVAGRTYELNKEQAIVSLKDGSRAIIEGGPEGIRFGDFDVRRVLLHTHPVTTGPSLSDKGMLVDYGQRSSWVYELFGGGLSRFRQ